MYIPSQYLLTINRKRSDTVSGVQAGGIFVNEEAARQIKQILAGAAVPRAILQDWIHSAEEDFEMNLKLDFPRSNGRHSLSVDRQSYNNPAVGIKHGRLNLDQ